MTVLKPLAHLLAAAFSIIIADIEPIFDFLAFGFNDNALFHPYRWFALLGYPILVVISTIFLIKKVQILSLIVPIAGIVLAAIFEVVSLQRWRCTYYQPKQLTETEEEYQWRRWFAKIMVITISITLACLCLSALALLLQWTFPSIIALSSLVLVGKVIGYLATCGKEFVNYHQGSPCCHQIHENDDEADTLQVDISCFGMLCP